MSRRHTLRAANFQALDAAQFCALRQTTINVGGATTYVATWAFAANSLLSGLTNPHVALARTRCI